MVVSIHIRLWMIPGIRNLIISGVTFMGHPEMDDRLFQIESKNVFYIGSHFTILNRKASADKNFVWRLRDVAASDKSDVDKGAELLCMIKKFAAEDYKVDKS